MSDAIKHLDLDSDEFQDAPKAVRDYAKSLKKQLEAVSGELDGVRTQLTSRAVSDVLGDKGFKNPKAVERALLADSIDPLDTSAVEAWLTENGDDYAKGETKAGEPAPEQQSAEQQALAAGHQQMAAASGERAPGGQTPYERAQSKITPDMTGAQVAAVFKEFGV